MGMIINIDEALKNRTDFNVLKEPLHAMMQAQQEAWEKENPIDMIFNRGSISSFQETYTSSIGFAHAFSETADYSVGPIFNTAEGFAATYRTRTFQGSFIITKQVLEDGNYGQVKDTASQFVKRWHGDIVDYAMKSLEGGFTSTGTQWVAGDGGVSKLLLTSADTTDGKIDNPVKNPLFSAAHKTVARDGVSPITQSNVFAPDTTIDLAGSDAGKISKLAMLIDQVITQMENYKDDNGKYAAVNGRKTIVCANDPILKAAIKTALEGDMFKHGESVDINPAYDRCDFKYTPYLNDIGPTASRAGFFIVDKGYNAENHGLELTERIPFTLEVLENKRPYGIIYDGRERFDINVASWRGIAYVSLTAPSSGNISVTVNGSTATVAATSVAVGATIVKEVEVVNPSTSPVQTTVVS